MGHSCDRLDADADQHQVHASKLRFVVSSHVASLPWPGSADPVSGWTAQFVEPVYRSSLTRWRQRMGEEKVKALLQESLSIAVKTEAVKPSELSEVIIDTTVEPKNVMFPTDVRLLNRAREILGACPSNRIFLDDCQVS